MMETSSQANEAKEIRQTNSKWVRGDVDLEMKWKKAGALRSGWDELDQKVLNGGFHRHEVCEIVGPSGVGKTQLLASVIANSILEFPQQKVAFITAHACHGILVRVQELCRYSLESSLKKDGVPVSREELIPQIRGILRNIHVYVVTDVWDTVDALNDLLSCCGDKSYSFVAVDGFSELVDLSHYMSFDKKIGKAMHSEACRLLFSCSQTLQSAVVLTSRALLSQLQDRPDKLETILSMRWMVTRCKIVFMLPAVFQSEDSGNINCSRLGIISSKMENTDKCTCDILIHQPRPVAFAESGDMCDGIDLIRPWADG